MENLIPTLKSVSELIEDFESGNIAIPEIQRDVVWDADDIKALIDSIGRGYPCGSLILWEPRENDKSLVRSMIRPERIDQFGGILPRYFLLDGQQRVTALASITLKRDLFRSLVSEVEEEMPLILANLRRFPREIEATTDLAGYSFPWVLFNELFAGTAQAKPEYANLSQADTENVKRYMQRLRDYKFPVQIIRDRDYATVAEIFTRVNSQGTQLTGAEIHLARIVPHWRGITKEFRDYRRQLGQKNYELDLTFLMRAITVVECRVPQIQKLAEKVAKDHPSRKHLNKTWKLARTATDRLVRVLQRELLLDRSKYFTSKNALVPLVYYLANAGNGRSGAKMIQRFFVMSQLSEHYGGGAETALRKDFRILTDPALSSPRQGLSELVTSVEREARQYYRGLKIRPDHVWGLPSKNVFVLLMYILMRSRDATDWGHNGKLLAEIEPKEMQLHHIFPFDFMMKHKAARKVYLDEGRSPADFRTDVNDIANLTFLSQGKNVGIGDTPPWQYLPNETTKQSRKAHFIPESPDLWKPERFSKFLDERSSLLARAMTVFLKRLT